jgi:hypothetical protein
VVVGLGAGAAGDLLEAGIGLGFDARALFVAAASGQGAKIPSRKSSGAAIETVPKREAKSAPDNWAGAPSDAPFHATNKITAAIALAVAAITLPVATIACFPLRAIFAVIGVPPRALPRTSKSRRWLRRWNAIAEERCRLQARGISVAGSRGFGDDACAACYSYRTHRSAATPIQAPQGIRILYKHAMLLPRKLSGARVARIRPVAAAVPDRLAFWLELGLLTFPASEDPG